MVEDAELETRHRADCLFGTAVDADRGDMSGVNGWGAMGARGEWVG